MSWLAFFFTKILCIHTGYYYFTAKWQKIASKKKLLDVASGMIRTQFIKILLNKK
jgi:hypothetical protein